MTMAAVAAGLAMAVFNSCITTRLGTAHHRKSLRLHQCPRLTLSTQKKRWKVHASDANVNGVPQKQISFKDFMEEVKTLGRIRIIVNTGVSVLESVTRMDGLFYHTLEGRGEYANVMDKDHNVDFHLLVDKVTGARLVQGKSKKNDTYMIRLMDDNRGYAASFLLMWDPNTDGEYDPGQVEAFQNLMHKCGSDVKFV